MTLKVLYVSIDRLNIVWILGPELVPILQRSGKPCLRASLFLKPITQGKNLQEQPIQVLGNTHLTICDLNDLKRLNRSQGFAKKYF